MGKPEPTGAGAITRARFIEGLGFRPLSRVDLSSAEPLTHVAVGGTSNPIHSVIDQMVNTRYTPPVVVS